MQATRPRYHHGDLRAKLIAAAMACIERDGVAGLSLRRIAADLGVSHNAPYMHFPTKDALLDAVIAAGFAMLRAEIAQAGGPAPRDGDAWRAGLRDGCRAYVAFARARPGLYALMHVPRGGATTPRTARRGDVADASDGHVADADAAGAATLDALAATLAAGQALGAVRSGDAAQMALWVWVTLHGLASLTGQERRAFGRRTPAAVSDTVLDMLVSALGD